MSGKSLAGRVASALTDAPGMQSFHLFRDGILIWPKSGRAAGRIMETPLGRVEFCVDQWF